MRHIGPRPSSSRSIRSASCPSTTITGSSPATTALRTAPRTTVPPSMSRSSLLVPIRLDGPAASTTPPTFSVVSNGMDRGLTLAEMHRLATRNAGEQLRNDAHGDLLRSVRAKVEADRPENAFVVFRAELAEDFLGASARSQHADVRHIAPQQSRDPLGILFYGVRLDDCVSERAQLNVGRLCVGPRCDETNFGGIIVGRDISRTVIDDGDAESNIRRASGERASIFSSPENDQRRRRHL